MKDTVSPTELKRTRKRLKMSQSAFADAIGVTQATVSRWESSVHPIDVVTSAGIRAAIEKLERQAVRA